MMIMMILKLLTGFLILSGINLFLPSDEMRLIITIHGLKWTALSLLDKAMNPLVALFSGLGFQQERALLCDDLELSCAVRVSDDQDPVQALSLVDRPAAQV